MAKLKLPQSTKQFEETYPKIEEVYKLYRLSSYCVSTGIGGNFWITKILDENRFQEVKASIESESFLDCISQAKAWIDKYLGG